jgi:carboxylesterase type B
VPCDSYGCVPELGYDGGKPAWHCADIPFAFHNAAMVPVCNIQGVSERLEEEYCGAYVAFARTGNPNHSALPYWSAFTPDHKATMVFDRKSELRLDYDGELEALLIRSVPMLRPEQMPREDD